MTNSRRSIVVPEVRDDSGAPELVAVVRELAIGGPEASMGESVAETLGLDGAAVAKLTEGWRRVDGPALRFELYGAEGGDRVGVTGFGAASPTYVDRADAADQVLAQVTRHVLDTDVDQPHLHGGAVADAEGRAVLVLGSSGAGKSTLTAHLVAGGGWGLVTDEQITLFSEQGLVGGFTRPVAIKRSGFAFVSPLAERVDEQGAVRLLTAASLGTEHVLAGRPTLIVLPERDDDADEVSWEVVPPAEAVVELCANNLDLVRRPVEALNAFGWLATTATMVRLRYRDAADAADYVAKFIDTVTPAPALEWSVVGTDHDGEGEMAATVSSAPARPFRVAPETVALSIEDEVVLFHAGTRAVARLNPPAAAMWFDGFARGFGPVGDDGGLLFSDLERRGFVQQV